MLSDLFDFRSSFREMERLRREVNQIFDQMNRGSLPGIAVGYPAMNLWTNTEGAVVTAELPGINPDELDISVRGNTLTLKGSRQREELGEDVVVHRQERGYGQFQRALQLPYEVAADGVTATYEQGVLSITLPWAESSKPRKIQVQTK